jgi:hypothetical protein
VSSFLTILYLLLYYSFLLLLRRLVSSLFGYFRPLSFVSVSFEFLIPPFTYVGVRGSCISIHHCCSVFPALQCLCDASFHIVMMMQQTSFLRLVASFFLVLEQSVAPCCGFSCLALGVALQFAPSLSFHSAFLPFLSLQWLALSAMLFHVLFSTCLIQFMLFFPHKSISSLTFPILHRCASAVVTVV